MWRDRLDDIEIALVQAGAQAKAPGKLAPGFR